MSTTPEHSLAASDLSPSLETLERNLRALSIHSPVAARAVAASLPHPQVQWLLAVDGGATGVLPTESGRLLRLASLVDPIAEGEEFAGTFDPFTHAAAAVAGFACGHHVRALLNRVGKGGMVIAFEPDVSLLRSLFEHVDLSDWLAHPMLRVVVEADASSVAAAATRAEAILGLGTRLLTHLPSRLRLGESTADFDRALTATVSAVRTNVVTTLVQCETTLRNLLQNADHYATRPGIADLAGVHAARPAIVVAAGPSLARNIHLLKDPSLRERVVIIAAQTVLKTLLREGIRPHFVTALDHHEISRRFYEGLTANDVEGVTLVAEPKVNPAVIQAYPGEVRFVRDELLDLVLGEALVRDLGGDDPARSVPPGATVAHLSYSLARHMGCDPVVLVGQDLGFTDGQYYAAGAAIHGVWSAELNDFNTLEMMEWERIVRMRSMLRVATDHLGRPIYTDEQMATYLVQFERDFAADAARGLRIIDATEGGVSKQHTRPMPLADAIEFLAPRDATTLASMPIPKLTSSERVRRLQALQRRVDSLREDVTTLASRSRSTVDLLREMLDHHADQSRVNRLIARVEAIAGQVRAAEHAFRLVEFLNQTGSLRRFRNDRHIALERDLSELERQKRRIERDIDNVTWIADAADQAKSMLGDCLGAIAGGPRVTRDASAADHAASTSSDATKLAPDLTANSRPRVAAIIQTDTSVGGLGQPRDLAAHLASGRHALALTLERLARCSSIDTIAIATPQIEHVRRLTACVEPLLVAAGKRLIIAEADQSLLRDRLHAMRGGRSWSRTSWRGGVGRLTVFDEVCCPKILAPIAHELELDAAVLVGPDWPLVDPALIDALVARHAESPDQHPLTFTQAPPGLAPCLVSASLLDELAASSGPLASLGVYLGYIPVAPQADPIARGACVSIPSSVRDLHHRFIADAGQTSLAASILREHTGRHHELTIESISRWCLEHDDQISPATLPPIIDLRLAAPDVPPISASLIDTLARELSQRPDAALSLVGEPDAADHPRLAEIVEYLRKSGPWPIHVRTRLIDGVFDAERLARLAPDIISVDIPATHPSTYHALTGLDALSHVEEGLNTLARWADAQAHAAGLPHTWIVPRITRRDAVYEQIEGFYDMGLMRFGSCVIDPLPAPVPGERIAPLPLPSGAKAALQRSRLVIDPLGHVRDASGTFLGTLGTQRLSTLYRRATASHESTIPLATAS